VTSSFFFDFVPLGAPTFQVMTITKSQLAGGVVELAGDLPIYIICMYIYIYMYMYIYMYIYKYVYLCFRDHMYVRI